MSEPLCACCGKVPALMCNSCAMHLAPAFTLREHTGKVGYYDTVQVTAHIASHVRRVLSEVDKMHDRVMADETDPVPPRERLRASLAMISLAAGVRIGGFGRDEQESQP